MKGGAEAHGGSSLLDWLAGPMKGMGFTANSQNNQSVAAHVASCAFVAVVVTYRGEPVIVIVGLFCTVTPNTSTTALETGEGEAAVTVVLSAVQTTSFRLVAPSRTNA